MLSKKDDVALKLNIFIYYENSDRSRTSTPAGS